MIPDSKLDEIEQLARAATAGEWVATDGGIVKFLEGSTVGSWLIKDPMLLASNSNLRHAAAANPATVLELIAELRAARRVVEACRFLVEKHTPEFSVRFDRLKYLLINNRSAE